MSDDDELPEFDEVEEREWEHARQPLARQAARRNLDAELAKREQWAIRAVENVIGKHRTGLASGDIDAHMDAAFQAAWDERTPHVAAAWQTYFRRSFDGQMPEPSPALAAHYGRGETRGPALRDGEAPTASLLARNIAGRLLVLADRIDARGGGVDGEVLQEIWAANGAVQHASVAFAEVTGEPYHRNVKPRRGSNSGVSPHMGTQDGTPNMEETQ